MVQIPPGADRVCPRIADMLLQVFATYTRILGRPLTVASQHVPWLDLIFKESSDYENGNTPVVQIPPARCANAGRALVQVTKYFASSFRKILSACDPASQPQSPFHYDWGPAAPAFKSLPARQTATA